MRKRIVILAALACFLVSSSCYAASADSVAGNRIALEKVDYAAATVTVDKLNIREGPSTSYPSIGKLNKGQEVTIIGRLGDWYAIYNAGDGIIGAVDGRYIAPAGQETAATASVTDNAALEAVNKKSDDKSKDKTNDKVNDKTSNKSDNKSTPKTVPKTAPKTTPKTAPNTTPAKGATPSAVTVALSGDEQKLLDLVNKARTEQGVEPLAIDENLMKVARTKAKDMIENGYFSHQSPTYGSPFDMMRQFNNTFKTAGENIAGNKTVEGAFKAWMASDSHKKNILNSGFRITGIGIEDSATYGKIIVQQFIGR